jgi:O-Glycosyl hydrolase
LEGLTLAQKKMTVYLTQKGTGNKLTKQDGPEITGGSQAAQLTLNLYPFVTYQKFLGFGGAFTESAADTFYQLDADKREEILRAYFDGAQGNGYTFGRTHMNSCDFSLGNYACDETPDDFSLSDFSIAHEKAKLIPMIKEAMRFGPIHMLLSPWSPPAWMKSNHMMNNGGFLLENYRKTWADYYVKFIRKYKDEGIPFWGLTVQNEPMAEQTWDSCIFTGAEEKDFVKLFLAPALKDGGLDDVKILVWDHNRDMVLERAKEILDDAEANEAVWGVGFHWYGGDHFEALDAIHTLWPDKQLVFTEGCKENGPSHGSWDVGERYGHEIIGDLNHYSSAWFDWNLLLNQDGGPNHADNLCDAPILANLSDGTLEYETSYWYIGHFSRFIKPDSVRIGFSRSSDQLECTAFKNPDDSIAVVLMNKSDEDTLFNANLYTQSDALHIPAHSIMTILYTTE